jgi:hypothetical protein
LVLTPKSILSGCVIADVFVEDPRATEAKPKNNRRSFDSSGAADLLSMTRLFEMLAQDGSVAGPGLKAMLC